MKKLMIVDGNSLIYRAFYALPVLTNAKGEYSNAIYGFCNILIKMITENRPDYLAVAFDVKHPTFRHDMYTEYKGTRKPMPEELRPQFPALKNILKAMDITVLEKPGLEGDDIIGILSKRFKEHTVIVSGDRDVLQLVDDTTNVWLTKKGISTILKYDEAKLFEDYSLTPNQIVESKALMGDSSDNIPGVGGVGEKTALKLLTEYKTLEGVYENIDSIKGKLQERLINDKEKAFLSRDLARIKTQDDLKCEIEELTFDFPFNGEVYKLFNEYNFSSLLKREDIFDSKSVEETEVFRKVKINTIKTEAELENLKSKLLETRKFSFYIGNDVHISYSKFEENIIKINQTLLDDGLNLDFVLQSLKNILADEKIKKTMYNYKTTKTFLIKNNIELKGTVFDVSLAEYLLNTQTTHKDNIKKLSQVMGYEEGVSAVAILRARDEYTKDLDEKNLNKLYFDIEFPLMDVLFKMERAGIKIDEDMLNTLTKDYKVELEVLNNEIVEMAGKNFNVNSPKQLAEVLFDDLKIEAWNNKKRSTREEVLLEIRYKHPIVSLILRYRKVAKLYSTYLEGLKPYVQGRTHLIHTTFNQKLTATGRLSSIEPNLQNIPIRTKEGRNLRKMFVSRFEEGVLIAADYSQIELRLLAHYSADEKLIEAYKRGEDIHAKTASGIFGVPLAEVSKELRSKAKAINFGIIYGISDYGLSQNIGSTRAEAKNFIDKYFETYPTIKQFMESQIEKAKTEGYVSTLMGRIRKIPEMNSSNYNTRQFGERIARNMPLQGTASDIIKIAMINIINKIEKLNLKAKLILQIHDELIIDCPKSEIKTVRELLRYEMENVLDLKVDLTVDINEGKTWFEAK